MSEDLIEALFECFISDDVRSQCTDQSANVVDALDSIAQALSIGLSRLGTNDASTQMGAIELLSLSVKEGCSDIAQGIFNGLELIAQAIANRPGGVE